jgi:demethylmenaquinone methyltransferase/2-methoxy-6-polyprenyl-1,4-benzoquinol methylase
MGSGAMFDRIARRYDLLNRVMSLGMDRRWRRHLVAALGALKPGDRVLDVATGTADVALTVADLHAGVKVVGLDPSAGMLDVGRGKVGPRSVELVLGDAQGMPFEDNTFAGVTIAFGIRNVPDRLQGLREMARVTRAGGRVCVLELGEPPPGPPRWYVHHIVPLLGSLLSSSKEYRYLQTSIAAFPPPGRFAELMAEAGLREVTVRPLGFGACHLYVGVA